MSVNNNANSGDDPSASEGSVTLAIRTAKKGDREAGEEVLRLICTRKDSWDRLQSIASRLNVTPADRDHFVNEALRRLYNGLVLDKFKQVSDRESLFRLIGGIVRKCVSESHRNEQGKRKSAVRATQGLPDNQADQSKVPDELVQLRDGLAVFRQRLESAVPDPSELKKYWHLLELRLENLSETEIRKRTGATVTDIKRMDELMRKLIESPGNDN
jgi:hypothetical protein